MFKCVVSDQAQLAKGHTKASSLNSLINLELEKECLRHSFTVAQGNTKTQGDLELTASASRLNLNVKKAYKEPGCGVTCL